MERRKSVRCAVIQAQRELKMKENEEAAKQVTSEERLKPLSMRPSNQPRNTTSKSLHALPDEKRKSKVGPKSKEPLTSPAPQLSDYEKQIQKNIEERKKMFEMMVSSAKREFLQAVSLEASSTSKQLSVKRKRDSADEDGGEVYHAPRRSQRKSEPRVIEWDYKTPTRVPPPKLPISLTQMEDEMTKLPSDMQDFLELMKTFSFTGKNVLVSHYSSIFSMDWHSGTTQLLLATGDKNGNIGVVNADYCAYQKGAKISQVHGQAVNCVTFDRYNPSRVLSTSCDGFVCSLDLNTVSISDKIFSLDGVNGIHPVYHAQKDASTILVSQSNGDVVVLDLRVSANEVSNKIRCFQSSAKTLSLHPLNSNLFVTCSLQGESGIFDLRCVTQDELALPVTSFPTCSKEVISSFFSPITGHFVLQTCMDNTLKVYDVQRNEAQCVTSIDHVNFVTKTTRPIQATWHPRRDDVFLVGCMELPRRVDLFGASTGQLLHSFDGLVSIDPITAFHPSVPILAGGNSTGRIHFFRP